MKPSLPGCSGSRFPVKEFGGLYQFPFTFLQTYKVYCVCQNKPAKCWKIEGWNVVDWTNSRFYLVFGSVFSGNTIPNFYMAQTDHKTVLRSFFRAENFLIKKNWKHCDIKIQSKGEKWLNRIKVIFIFIFYEIQLS